MTEYKAKRMNEPEQLHMQVITALRKKDPRLAGGADGSKLIILTDQGSVGAVQSVLDHTLEVLGGDRNLVHVADAVIIRNAMHPNLPGVPEEVAQFLTAVVKGLTVDFNGTSHVKAVRSGGYYLDFIGRTASECQNIADNLGLLRRQLRRGSIRVLPAYRPEDIRI